MALEDAPAEHHRLICRALDDVVSGVTKNLMIFCPPGSAKSTYGNTLLSPYWLGRFPQDRVINCSYNYDLAVDFGRKARNLVAHPRYRAVFDLMLSPDTREKGHWEIHREATEDAPEVQNFGFETLKRGGYVAAGVGSGLTGRRGNIGIIDDPVKDAKDADSEIIQKRGWDWYVTVFLTRLLPGAPQVIIQTRWTDNDISGRILPEGWAGESGTFEGRDGREWRVICLPAIIETPEQAEHDPLNRKVGEVLWPEYYSREHWQTMRKTYFASPVTTRHWYALYQQVPKPLEGTYFKRDWFKWYDPENPPAALTKFISSDFAVTDSKDNPDADWTEAYVSGMDVDHNLFMALDGFYVQDTSDVWLEKWLDLSAQHKPRREFHEGGVIRKSIEPFLKKRRRERRVFTRISWLNPIADKSARLRSFQNRAAMGTVYLPRNDLGERLLRHLLEFPNSSMDHGPDACGTLALGLDEMFPPTVEKPKPKPRRRDYEESSDVDGAMIA